MATSRRKRVPKGIQQALKRQAIKGEIRQPDLAKLVAHFFKNAGGEGAVAKMLYDEFVAAPPGGIARQRIMDMILRGLKWANESEAPQDDLGILTEDDLERELDQLIEEAAPDEPDTTQHGADPAAHREEIDQPTEASEVPDSLPGTARASTAGDAGPADPAGSGDPQRPGPGPT